MEGEKPKDEEKVPLPDDYFVTAEDASFLPPKYENIFTISDKVVLQPKNKKPDFGSARRCRCLLAFLVFMILLFVLCLAFLGLQLQHSHRFSLKNKFERNVGFFRGNCPLSFADNPSIKGYMEKIELHNRYAIVGNSGYRDYLGATVLHQFLERKTIIRTENMCLIKPMRSDLKRPIDIEDLITKLQNGDYIPQAHLTHENWYLRRPQLTDDVIFEKYGPRVFEMCSKVPTFEMVSLSAYPRTERVGFDSPRRRPIACPQVRCDKCPPGTVRQMDVNGCITTCDCVSQTGLADKTIGDIACPHLDTANCAIMCPLGYEKDNTNGCYICRCRAPVVQEMKGLLRKRRDIVEPVVDQNNCVVKMHIFEGVMAGDEKQLGVLDDIYVCEM